MNKILRYIVLVGVFIIPFIPLIVVNSYFFPYITGKNFAFRILIELILGAWVVLAATDSRYRPRKSWIFWSLAVFVAVMFVADLFSVYPYKSFWSNYERMEGYVTLIHLFALFVIAAGMFKTERIWKWFWNTSILVSLIIAVYAFLQLAGKIQVVQGAGRVDGTFGNAAYMAVYALFHIFITAYIVFSNKQWFVFVPEDLQKNKWLKFTIGAVIIIIEAIVLYYTETRGTMLGLIGGVGVSALLIAVFERNRKNLRRASIGVIIAALIVVVGFIAIKNTSFVKKSSTLSRFASISLSDNTTKSRFLLWNMAWQGFKEHPILGWGQESFNYVFNKYYNPALYNQEQWFDRTHNVFFDWLIAGGIAGLGTYLWFFIATIWYAWKNDSMTLPEKSIMIGLLVGYFIHNLFVFDNLTSYVMFFMVAAYIHMHVAHNEEAAHAHGVEENRVILPVAVVCTILVLYFVNYNAIMANTTLIQAISDQSTAAKLGIQNTNNTPYGGDVTKNVALFQQALDYHSFGTPEIREQIFSMADSLAQTQTQSQTPIQGLDALNTLATQQAEAQTTVTPNDARYQVLTGVLYDRLGNYAAALPHLQKAAALSPQKQTILFELGTAYIGNKQYPQAEQIFKTAYDLAPEYDEAALYYAISAIYNKDQKTADAVLAKLPKDTVLQSDPLVYAYYSVGAYDQVLAIWKARVAENPNDPQMHLSLAAAYILVNDRKDAIAEIHTVEKLYPAFQSQGDEYIKEIQAGKNP